ARVQGKAQGRVPREMKLAPNTPVIVGVGFEEQRSQDPTECSEPYELMVAAVRAAARDAGSDALLRDADSISVPQGLWHYKNPCTLVADAIGCRAAKTIVSDLGVLQLTLLSELCRAIVAGERHVGIITAGEAKFRELRGTITQQPAVMTHQGDDTP